MKSRVALLSLLFVMLYQTPVGLRAQESPTSTQATEEVGAPTPMAPVVVDGTTLFPVRGVSAYPAEQRAHDIAEHIVAVASDPSFSRDSLALSARTDGTDVMAGNKRIMSVVDADSRLEGVRR